MTKDAHPRADLLPLHDELVFEARFALHQALACLDMPRAHPRARHAASRDTAERLTVALDLLHRAELAVAGRDSPAHDAGELEPGASVR